MCNLSTGLINKGIAQGRTQGIAEGIAEGIAQGRTEGIAQGRAEGIAEGRDQMVEAMIRHAYTTEAISSVSGLSTAEIEEIRANMEK